MPKDLAMDINEEKKLLISSKRKFVYCAIASGYGDTRGFALFRMHRTKKPRELAKELSKDFEDARNIRFGIVSIDGKTVKVELNKPAPGLDKKLIRSLKGTGFSKTGFLYSSSAARGKSGANGAKGQTKDQDESDKSNAFEKLLKKFGLDNDAALRQQKKFLDEMIKKKDERLERGNVEKVRKTLETVQQFGWEALKLKETCATTLSGSIRNVVRLPANISNTISDDRMLAILTGLAAFLTDVQAQSEA
jgi:hypothetical protein